MAEPRKAIDILREAARKTPGKLTTVSVDGRRLAIVDAAWFEELVLATAQLRDAAEKANSFDSVFTRMFGGKKP